MKGKNETASGTTTEQHQRKGTLMDCNCKDEANRKVDNGELSQALSRSHTITASARESLVRQALDRRSLRGRFVDTGEVRDSLSNAGWSQNHIDFLLYRSQHEHEKDWE
jgi:hypothetical protein